MKNKLPISYGNHTINSKDIKFDYRYTDLAKDLIFLSASFKGYKKKKEEILEKWINFKKNK